MEAQFVYVGTQRVAYYRAASSVVTVPLVLLHGFCEDRRIWQAWVPPAQFSDVILIDLPGFGQSDRARQTDLSAYADAVLAVLDTLGVSRCVLVGHSLGGYVGLSFFEKNAHRVAGLGLFHSHPFADTDERRQARQRGIELVQSGRHDLYVAQLFPNLFSETFKKNNPHQVAQLIAWGQQQSPEGIADALAAMRDRPDYRPVMARVACPFLLLLGKEDALIPPTDTLATAMLPRQSEAHLLPDVAHMGMYEAPADTWQVVWHFFKKCQ
jgi:pimeloyl-ACP methyl ester carboxylesterase